MFGAYLEGYSFGFAHAPAFVLAALAHQNARFHSLFKSCVSKLPSSLGRAEMTEILWWIVVVTLSPVRPKGLLPWRSQKPFRGAVSTPRHCGCCRLLSPHLAAGKRACRRFNLPRIFVVSRMLRGVMWNRGRLRYFSKDPADVTTSPGLCWSFTAFGFFKRARLS